MNHAARPYLELALNLVLMIALCGRYASHAPLSNGKRCSRRRRRRAESIFLYLLSAAIHHSFVVPALETSSAAAAEQKNALCEWVIFNCT
jgi:hypothetical protein